MRATLSLLLAGAAVVAAQNSTSLPDLVTQLPTCAAPCLTKGADAAGCASTDFACLCSDTNKNKFLGGASECVLEDCHGDDFSKVLSVAGQICTVVTTENPDPSAVASASAIVTSALSAASATSSPDSASVRTEFGFGILGAAAVAALAL